jgi:hypothetical protein
MLVSQCSCVNTPQSNGYILRPLHHLAIDSSVLRQQILHPVCPSGRHWARQYPVQNESETPFHIYPSPAPLHFFPPLYSYSLVFKRSVSGNSDHRSLTWKTDPFLGCPIVSPFLHGIHPACPNVSVTSSVPYSAIDCIK